MAGQGMNQILMAWDETSTSAQGKRASMYIRSKSSTPTAAWSPWFEIIDSGNFTKYMATSSGEGATGTWDISILGNAQTARYLLPITANGTYGDATYNLPSGSGNRVIWSEAFGDNSLQYAANGELHDYTDTGDIVFYLSPNPTSDELLLNMYINGTYEGNFLGDLNGIATQAQRAAMSTGTNTLAYYDNTLGHFNYTSYIKYLKHLSVATESGQPNAAGYSDGLIITSDATYYSLSDVIAQQNGILKYGDAGPQIRFNSENYYGAILFNTHTETAGAWPSFHFVGMTESTTTPTTKTYNGITIKSAGVVASAKATVGVETLNSTYVFAVTGESGFYSNINMVNSLIHFSYNKQYIEWYDAAGQRTTNDDASIGTGLKWNGIGTYTASEIMYLNISNYNGINITTKDDITLYHNGNVIPASENTSLGSATQPVYIVDGLFAAATYSLSATILSGVANRMAYYNTGTSIDDAGHYVNNSKIAINSTSEPTTTLHVAGNASITTDLYIGSTGNRTINYIGTQTNGAAITFIDNAEDLNGNGMVIGTGGLTVIGAGTCVDPTNILGVTGVGPSTTQLYLFSDVAINLEANASTFANRTGIQITSTGDVVPVQSEAAHTNLQSLGSSTARWKALFIGDADTHGGPGQPVYWSDGVPVATTYALGAGINSGTALRLAYYSGNNAISNTTITSNGEYLGNVSYLSINHAHQTDYRLYLDGNGYVTGNITFAEINAVQAASKLMWSGGNDSASIYYKLIGANTGQLVINTGTTAQTNDCLLVLAHNDDDTMRFNLSTPVFYPTQSGGNSALGIGANGTEANARRWGKVFVGTADSYGDAYTPVYWNAGVPAAVTVVQQADFTIANAGTSVVITKNNIYTGETMVLQIVVTSGEANLTGPISWASAANKVTLTTTATTGEVKGYILTARGAKI